MQALVRSIKLSLQEHCRCAIAQQSECAIFATQLRKGLKNQEHEFWTCDKQLECEQGCAVSRWIAQNSDAARKSMVNNELHYRNVQLKKYSIFGTIKKCNRSFDFNRHVCLQLFVAHVKIIANQIHERNIAIFTIKNKSKINIDKVAFCIFVFFSCASK